MVFPWCKMIEINLMKYFFGVCLFFHFIRDFVARTFDHEV